RPPNNCAHAQLPLLATVTALAFLSLNGSLPQESPAETGCARQTVGGSVMHWDQVYNPFNSQVLSTIAAALPVVTLLVLIASNKVKANIAPVLSLIVAKLVT